MQLRDLRSGGVFGAAVVAMLAFAGSVQAVPIDSDLTIMGSLEYDTGFSFVDNASHSGTMATVVGGATTTTTYGASSPGFQAGAAVGANPLLGTLTDIGDGLGITGASSSGDTTSADAEFGIGIDLVITLTNTSATDTFQVTVGTTFLNSVNSAGTDAYVDSEFTLDSTPPGTEVFFTALITDTVNGNEVGGNPVAGFGGPLSESGIDTLVLTLMPGESYILEGDWTMEGGAFADATSSASLDAFFVNVSIDEVLNLTTPPTVPEPGTVLLLGGGLVGLVWGRRRRRPRR